MGVKMEPKIIINGIELTDGQSMTVRAGIESFSSYLSDDDVLGRDEHGRLMVAAYRDRLSEVSRILIDPNKAKRSAQHKKTKQEGLADDT